jgi:hypothetical protein
MLSLYVAIDGEKTVSDLVQEVQISQVAFKKAFVKLVKLGLIEEAGSGERYVEDTFLADMRKVITKLMGPLGGLLIDDTAMDMGFKKDRIPVSSLHHFITVLAREIPSQKQSDKFREIIFEKMREIGM